MHTKFIVRGNGYWGGGETPQIAEVNYQKAVRKGPKPKSCRILDVTKYTSELPFAPPDREATEGEADAYIDQQGATCWVRCEREFIYQEK